MSTVNLHDIVSCEAVPGDPSTRRLGYVERLLERSAYVLVRWEDDRAPWCHWAIPMAPAWRVNDPGDVLSVRLRRWHRLTDEQRAAVPDARKGATDAEIDAGLMPGAITSEQRREQCERIAREAVRA